MAKTRGSVKRKRRKQHQVAWERKHNAPTHGHHHFTPGKARGKSSWKQLACPECSFPPKKKYRQNTLVIHYNRIAGELILYMRYEIPILYFY